jgi:glycosyltransferase involved in cell wall biosynthesis
MKIKICFVYPWATFGGCERVLINRALAFSQYCPDVLISFYFMHDAGGKHAFISALQKYGLEQTTSIVSSLNDSYDLVSLIDCPEAIKLCESKKQRYIVECHTGYANNRSYLKSLPHSCQQVIVPSLSFKKVIEKEFTSLSIPISLLRNFVPWDIQTSKKSKKINLPKWERKPILFFGRLDKLKDPLSILDAFKILENRNKGEFILLICGPQTPEINIKEELLKRSLSNSSVILPPIPFASTEALLNAVAEAGGIFVSPSKSESFGLAAAEAISSTLPVLLSDIQAHVDLTQEYENIFTYPQGNIGQLVENIEKIFKDYESSRISTTLLRNAFSAKRFMDDWNELLKKLEI